MNVVSALCGKLPAHGDFVDRNVAARELPHWNSLLERLNLNLTEPATAQCFVLGPGDFGNDWQVGTIIQSCDRVGRSFPIAVFVSGLSQVEAIFWAGQISELCLRIALKAQEERGNADEVVAKVDKETQTLNSNLVKQFEKLFSSQGLNDTMINMSRVGFWWKQVYSTNDDNTPSKLEDCIESNWDDIDEM